MLEDVLENRIPWRVSLIFYNGFFRNLVFFQSRETLWAFSEKILVLIFPRRYFSNYPIFTMQPILTTTVSFAYVRHMQQKFIDGKVVVI